MGKVFKPRRADGQKYEYWYYKYKDLDGIWKKAKGYKDKAATEAACRAKEKEIEQERAGIHTRKDSRRFEPIMGLVDEWIADVKRRNSEGKRGTGKTYRGILERFVNMCGWKSLASVSMDKVYEVLNANDWAGSTQNQYVRTLITFMRYCVEREWIAENPLRKWRKTRSKTYKQRKKRALTNAEINALLRTAPPRRALIYRIAMLSGFRFAELQQMTRLDVNPHGDKPRWQVRGCIDKMGECRPTPILTDIIADVRRLYVNAKGDEPLLGSIPDNRTLYQDLAAAGIARQDERGRWISFHSFRYTFCRLLAERLPIQVVKSLMRHSRLQMTADLYGHLEIEDLAEEVWQLPLFRLGEETQVDSGVVPLVVTQPDDQEEKPIFSAVS